MALFLTVFFFVLFSNWSGLVPGLGTVGLRTQAVIDHARGDWSLFDASVDAGRGRERLTTTLAFVGPGRGPHTDHLAPGQPLQGRLPKANERDTLELGERLGLGLGRHLDLFAGVRVGLWPSRALLVAWYGLVWRPGCRCFGLGVTASHRPDSPVPDGWLSISLEGG